VVVLNVLKNRSPICNKPVLTYYTYLSKCLTAKKTSTRRRDEKVNINGGNSDYFITSPDNAIA
jgi:hypothetical protein